MAIEKTSVYTYYTFQKKSTGFKTWKYINGKESTSNERARYSPYCTSVATSSPRRRNEEELQSTTCKKWQPLGTYFRYSRQVRNKWRKTVPFCTMSNTRSMLDSKGCASNPKHYESVRASIAQCFTGRQQSQSLDRCTFAISKLRLDRLPLFREGSQCFRRQTRMKIVQPMLQKLRVQNVASLQTGCCSYKNTDGLHNIDAITGYPKTL